MAQLSMARSGYARRGDFRREARTAFQEWAVHGALLVASAVSILTTAGIVVSLLGETVVFFSHVSVVDFLTQTEWTPLFSVQRFGIWPLVAGTVLTASIALLVAVPLGLVAAIYLSEFASPRARGVLKPVLEVLAGIPTVVYGYFALIVLTPFLQQVVPGLSAFNSLSAGLVMGIMILPLVSSLSEDALSAVPTTLREGGYSLGATKFEVATGIVVPAALSGITAAVILGLSRALGETMIVAIAAGQNPVLTLDPRVPIETMTAFIVQVSLGDTPAGSLAYQTIFAVGTTLFAMTFAMNVLSHWFVRHFRQVYE